MAPGCFFENDRPADDPAQKLLGAIPFRIFKELLISAPLNDQSRMSAI
jgi:hypothetical protein